MFDTHCHLNLFTEEKANKVIEGARQAGVNYFLVPGTNLETSVKGCQITSQYSHVYSAVGIHPTENLDKLNLNQSLFKLEEMLNNSVEKIIAVGEIGLDYYHLNTTPTKQKLFLLGQIQLALKHDKAIILHNRLASDDLLEVLLETGVNKISGRTVLHCCEENSNLLTFAKTNNLFLGVDGDVTFDPSKQDFVKKIPMELLVLETDSPFLLPEPLRSDKNGVRQNYPQNLRFIAQKIAQLKAVGVDSLVKITTENAKKLFGMV